MAHDHFGYMQQAIAASVLAALHVPQHYQRQMKRKLEGRKVLVEGGQQQWRECVARLREAGWVKLDRFERYQAFCDCHPCDTLPPRWHLMTCGKWYICPSCWGRLQTGANYKRVTSLFFPGGPRDTQPKPGLLLIGYRHREVHKVPSMPNRVPYLLNKYFEKRTPKELAQGQQDLRSPELDLMQSLKGFVAGTRCHYLIPQAEATVLERRGVIITRGQPWPLDAKGTEVRVYGEVTRKKIRDMLSWVFRFPASLLTADPVELVRIFDYYESRKYRLQSARGCFRGRKEEG